MVKRDTYLYTLRKGRKIVQYGITKNPHSRPIDHIRNGKNFSNITYDSYPKTWANAKAEETRKIQTYSQSHNTRYPRYNKIL